MNKKIKGLNVKILSLILITAGGLLFSTCIFFTYFTSYKYHTFETVSNNYIRTQQDIYDLKSASDYLTSKVRQYVMTGDLQYADEYFEEANVTKRRENAVDSIKESVADTGLKAPELLEQAMQSSTELMKSEIYAMSLIYHLYQTEGGTVPQEILDYKLSDADLSLNETGLKFRAYDIVFNAEYSAGKTKIDSCIETASQELMNSLEEYRDNSAEEYYTALLILEIMTISAAAVFAAIAVSLFVFILKPLHRSVEAIKDEQRIPLSNSYELNYLAVTYNEIYEKNASTRLKLKQRAEHDALTGLLNRHAFDKLKEFYSASDEVIALMIIDLDNFKSINDTYGHEAGDAALKRVAELITECFRSNDFPIRYGGDEFVVIMTELDSNQKGVISRKLQYINDTLMNKKKEGVPPLSLSVGIAFSQHGFEEDLMERADGALYRTKENGRCGFTFAD